MELSLRGQVSEEVALLFLEEIALLTKEDAPVVIELQDADMDDAKVVAMVSRQLRDAARSVGHLELRHAPQTLAHALYRLGASLPESPLKLVDSREEIGRSS